MTRATIYKSASSGEIVGFQTAGHAAYAKSGNDIVCAAVSMLVINTINAIEQFTADDCDVLADEEKALISLKVCAAKTSSETQVLLKALSLGLSQTARDYPDYLSITVEEV